MPKLTLSMIVKNEEKYLRECLESVKNVADEIIIVDTGSTDKTLEIAREFNAKIFYFNWINDFSAARNYALSKSTGDWILYLDADERLSKESMDELRKLTGSNEKTAIKCLVNSIDSKSKNSQMMKYIRLFCNNSNIKFSGKAHEQIEDSLLRNDYKIIDSDIEIIHMGYDVSEDILKEKAKRNLNLLLEDYSKQKNAYLAYQIANSYSVLNEGIKKNVFYLEALKRNPLPKELRSICFLNLAESELQNDNLEKAKHYFDKGILENEDHVLLNLIGSQIYGKIKDYETALNYCKNAYLFNKRKSAKISNQFIKIDNLKIIYQGILIAVISNNQENFKFFFDELSSQQDSFAGIIKKLLNQEKMEINDLIVLIDLTNEYNLELILKLLESYENINIKAEYLQNIYNNFNTNSKYLSYYGSFLLKQKNIVTGQEVLESAIKFESYDPAIIFYLSSLYVKTNQFEKLIGLLDSLEITAQSNPLIEKNLNLLKEKLMPLLSKSL